MAQACRCPDCGAVLNVEPRAWIEEAFLEPYHRRDQPDPRWSRRTLAVATCPACEFCIEITTDAPLGRGARLTKEQAS